MRWKGLKAYYTCFWVPASLKLTAAVDNGSEGREGVCVYAWFNPLLCWRGRSWVHERPNFLQTWSDILYVMLGVSSSLWTEPSKEFNNSSNSVQATQQFWRGYSSFYSTFRLFCLHSFATSWLLRSFFPSLFSWRDGVIKSTSVLTWPSRGSGMDLISAWPARLPPPSVFKNSYSLLVWFSSLFYPSISPFSSPWVPLNRGQPGLRFFKTPTSSHITVQKRAVKIKKNKKRQAVSVGGSRRRTKFVPIVQGWIKSYWRIIRCLSTHGAWCQ